MREEVSVDRPSVHLDGSDVVVALSAAAARRLAGGLSDFDADDGWFHDVARLLRAAAAEHDSSTTGPLEVSPTVLLRGHWSTDADLDGPLPFTEPRPLETIGPGLVGVWRTRLTGQSAAADETSPDSNVAVHLERLDAAARLVDAVASAKAHSSAAASARAVENRMSGARAALSARVSAATPDADHSQGSDEPAQPTSAAMSPRVPDRRDG